MLTIVLLYLLWTQTQALWFVFDKRHQPITFVVEGFSKPQQEQVTPSEALPVALIQNGSTTTTEEHCNLTCVDIGWSLPQIGDDGLPPF